MNSYYFLDDTDFSESESANVNKSFDVNNVRSPTSGASETEEESRDGMLLNLILLLLY